MEIPIKMDDLGVPLFSETPIFSHLLVFSFSKVSSPMEVEVITDPSQSHVRSLLIRTLNSLTSGNNEKNPGCLGCIGNYTTLSYRVYDIPALKSL